jgi:hypothetical protein
LQEPPETMGGPQRFAILQAAIRIDSKTDSYVAFGVSHFRKARILSGSAKISRIMGSWDLSQPQGC